MQNKTLLLIDANNLIFRFFSVFREKTIEYIFSHIKELEQSFPFSDYLLIFDNDQKTFRHEKYPAYKANRASTDSELKNMLKSTEEEFMKINKAQIAPIGYESEDLIATLAKNRYTYILSNDSDLFQLVSDTCYILRPRRGGDIEIFDAKRIKAELGISSKQVPDYKALVGDEKDNISGIKGIGETAARFLLNCYATIEEIYEHLDEIDYKYSKKLEEKKEEALFYKELCTLCDDVKWDKT